MKKSEWDLILSMAQNQGVQEAWASAMKIPYGFNLEFTVKADTSLQKFYVVHEETEQQIEYDLKEIIKKARLVYYMESKDRTLN